MKIDKNNRTRILLIVALALLGLLLLDRAVLTPALTGWRERQKAIGKLQSQLTSGGILLDQESRWLRQSRDARQRLLPADRSSAEKQMLALADAWARNAGLRVTSLRPLWNRSATDAPVLELQLTAVGGMRAVVDFLYAAETAEPAVAVEQLDLAAQGREGRELGLKVKISGLCRSTVPANGRNQ